MFDPDKFLSEKKKNLLFKSPDVESEFGRVDDRMKNIFSEAPYPMRVTSGYRDVAQNSAVGGVPNSYHTKGLGADLGLDTDPRAIDYLKSKGVKVIPEKDHFHTQMPDLQQVPKSNFDPDAFLGADAPQVETPQSMLETGESPLSLADRFKLGFGNQKGSLGYLDKSGKKGEFLGDDLFLKSKEGLQAADPDNMRGYAQLTAPGAAYYSIKDMIAGKNPASEFSNASISALKDLPSDIAETPASLMNLALTTMGGAAGGAAGALTGPLAPAAVPAGLVAGGGLGGLAAEKAKEGIGSALGTYQTEGEFLTPEAQKEAALAAASNLIPAAYMGGKELKNIGTNLLAKKGVPQKLDRALDSIPVYGKYRQLTREANTRTARDAFNAAETGRLSDYQNMVSGLKEDFRAQEALRKGSYRQEKDAARQAVKGLSGQSPELAGKDIAEAVKKAKSATGKEYGAAVDPIMKKYALSKASPEKLRRAIMKEMPPDLVDAKGNIISTRIKNVIAPERRSMFDRLDKISRLLRKNPSVSKMNEIVQDLQSIGFANEVPTREDAIFRNLSKSAKESLLDSVENVAGADEANVLRNARFNFSKKQPIFDELAPLSRNFDEKIASSLHSRVPGSFAVDAIEKIPELQKPLGQGILTNIGQRGRTPASLTKAIDEYGRDNLKRVLGDETLGRLVSSEQRMSSAFAPFERSIAPVPIPFKPGQPPDEEVGKLIQYLMGLSKQPQSNPGMMLPALSGQLGRQLSK